jgi:hypothetical protein
LSGFDLVAFSTIESAICEKSRFSVFFAGFRFAGFAAGFLVIPKDTRQTAIKEINFQTDPLPEKSSKMRPEGVNQVFDFRLIIRFA